MKKMDDVYEKIELQFYRDLKKSENEFIEHKNMVEQVMKANSLDYALEVVESHKKSSYYKDTYIKGYTLNLVIRKIDLHYVLKLLDENKIGFYANDEDKWKAISENEIYEDEAYEENDYSDEDIEKETLENNDEFRKRTNEENDKFARVFLSIVFSFMVFGDICLMYWFYNIGNYDYLKKVIIFTALQLVLFKLFLKPFKKKKDKIEYL